MALDKLVDSAQLDADLGDVADAIRAKGGTSAQLAFPAGFVSAIGDIQTGGGGSGLQYETGTITMTGSSKFSIAHNLGTDKVILFITPITGETYAASAGYRPFSTFVGNFNTICPFTVTLDYSAYHSSVSTEMVSSSDHKYRIGINNASPWTSQTSYVSPTGSPVDVINDMVTFSSNTITFGSGAYAAVAGTYKYCVVSLEGVTV